MSVDTGIYATAPKGLLPESLKYARACLEQGKSYQATAAICAINELDLREMLPGYSTRQSEPVKDAGPFVRVMRTAPFLEDEDLRRVVTSLVRLLEKKQGRETLQACLRAAAPGVLWDQLRLSKPTERRMGGWAGLVVASWAAESQGLTMVEMRSDRRSRDIARPRQIAMWLVRRFCPHLSLPAIGRVFGGRDHTTVIHAIGKIDALRENDPDFRAQIEAILAEATERFPMDEAA